MGIFHWVCVISRSCGDISMGDMSGNIMWQSIMWQLQTSHGLAVLCENDKYESVMWVLDLCYVRSKIRGNKIMFENGW